MHPVDKDYIAKVLIAAKATWQMRMTDPHVCEANRERAREHAKMADKGLELLREEGNANA